MKNRQINQGLFITFLLSASTVSAQEYPAANFQPKVIYSSEAAAPVENSASDPCRPKAEQTAIDPKYPAASFQPKVIFSDADAKQGFID